MLEMIVGFGHVSIGAVRREVHRESDTHGDGDHGSRIEIHTPPSHESNHSETNRKYASSNGEGAKRGRNHQKRDGNHYQNRNVQILERLRPHNLKLIRQIPEGGVTPHIKFFSKFIANFADAFRAPQNTFIVTVILELGRQAKSSDASVGVLQNIVVILFIGHQKGFQVFVEAEVVFTHPLPESSESKTIHVFLVGKIPEVGGVPPRGARGRFEFGEDRKKLISLERVPHIWGSQNCEIEFGDIVKKIF